MELTIHLQDGRQYPFTIADGQSSTEFFRGVKYWEIFDRPILRVHDRKDTWAFKPNAIEKIHFMTAEDPGWRPSENILSVKCITPESYQHKMAAWDAKTEPSAQAFEAGKVLETMLKITLASGSLDYFECTLMLRERRERLPNLYHLFQKVAYPIPSERGGFLLLNPAHMFCIHMHPSPPEDSDSAWLVDMFTGKNSDSRALATGSGKD